MGATAVALTVANRGIDAPSGLRPHLSDALFAVAMGAFAVVGALVATRRPGNVVGWLLLAQGLLWELGLMCAGWVAYAGFTAPGSLPFPELAGWLLAWIWAPAIAGVALLVLLFPDGRLPSRRWRVVVVLTVVSTSLSALAAALRPGPLVRVGSLVNPVGVVAVLAVSSASHALQATLAYGAPAANDPAVTQALFDAARMTDAATWFPLALFAGAAGMAGLQAQVLSRGLAAAGVGVAALGLAASAAMARHGALELGGPVAVLALMATVLWVLLAGVGLLRGGAARRRPAAEPVRVA